MFHPDSIIPCTIVQLLPNEGDGFKYRVRRDLEALIGWPLNMISVQCDEVTDGGIQLTSPGELYYPRVKQPELNQQRLLQIDSALSESHNLRPVMIGGFHRCMRSVCAATLSGLFYLR